MVTDRLKAEMVGALFGINFGVEKIENDGLGVMLGIGEELGLERGQVMLCICN